MNRDEAGTAQAATSLPANLGSGRLRALRGEAEKLALDSENPLPANIEEMSPAGIKRVFHELRVHQIELEMQNGELRKAQVELDGARARYFDLYSRAPVGYFSLSEKGFILEGNMTAAMLLGIDRDALVDAPLSRFVLGPDQDILYLSYKKLVESGEPQNFELRMVRSDGTSFWVHLEGVRTEDADGARVSRLVMSDISGRKSAEEALLKAQLEKQNLHLELQHRSKNSLNLIFSMISLAARGSVSPDTRTAMEDLAARVWSVSELYSLLYTGNSFEGMRLDEYCTRIAKPLLGLSGNIRLELQLEDIRAPMMEVSSLGLILTELLMNAVKYAFPGERRGVIKVTLGKTEDGAFLEVHDDGIGLPGGIADSDDSGTGLTLVRALVDQIRGRLTLLGTATGTRCSVSFPLPGSA